MYVSISFHIVKINTCITEDYEFRVQLPYAKSRVDVIWLSHLGMLCILCYSSLSIEECHNILPYQRASTPLTEPDLRISLIRLFSKTHSNRRQCIKVVHYSRLR
jgi:hypothetical protein